MGRIRPIVLGEQAKEYIMEAIKDGRLQPGDRVSESGLAHELGISQAPVRDAIRELSMLGFLEREPHRGSVVRSFSPKEQYEVYEVRAALESLAGRLATSRLTESDVQGLEVVLDGIIQAGRNQDLDRMTRLDNQFHEMIIEAAGNKLLHLLWKRLEFGYWTISTARRATWDLGYLANRHRELLEALKTGDPEVASDAMRRHIEDLGKPLLHPDEIEAIADGNSGKKAVGRAIMGDML